MVGELLSTDTYEYESAWKDQLKSYNGQSITYDYAGNPLQYKGNELEWDGVRKLVKYGNHTFAYDASGIRYQKNNITYTLDGDKIVKETDGVRTLIYYYGTNGVVGFNYSGNDYYYRKNLQGDVIEIYRADGVLVAGYEYDAWGKILRVNEYNNTGIGAINPFRYRSYYYDTETDLYYVKSRYYDPEIGRFINFDNLVSNVNKNLKGYNLFSYCFNNPANMVDKNGYWPQFIENAVQWINEYIIEPIDSVVEFASGITNIVFNNISASAGICLGIGIQDTIMETAEVEAIMRVDIVGIQYKDQKFRIGHNGKTGFSVGASVFSAGFQSETYEDFSGTQREVYDDTYFDIALSFGSAKACIIGYHYNVSFSYLGFVKDTIQYLQDYKV